LKNDKPPGWGYDAVHLPCVSRMVIHVASLRELKKNGGGFSTGCPNKNGAKNKMIKQISSVAIHAVTSVHRMNNAVKR
jgi:hypothetical protein